MDATNFSKHINSADSADSTPTQKAAVLYVAQKMFSLAQEDISNYFTNYYLLYWEPEFFKLVIERGTGTITRDGITYLVVYHSCTPTQLRESKQVRLSFRKPKKEYSSVGYVLVSCNS